MIEQKDAVQLLEELNYKMDRIILLLEEQVRPKVIEIKNKPIQDELGVDRLMKREG